MKKIRVNLARYSYDVLIGAGLLTLVGLFLKEKGYADKAVVITDPNVKSRYGEVLEQSLTKNGFKVTTLVVPAGEDQKSLDNAVRLYEQLTDAYAERSTPIVALGGGVIGDLTGFVAATYLRGVPFVQLPTTLLAQVDSSVGGKVAVDHERLKNKIGAFHQPRLVIADTDTLKTLPKAELANGLAEAIKTAAVRGKEFFVYLEQNVEKLRALDISALEEAVYQCVSIKAEIVEKDERDAGLRNILNFGHTIGHAIESVSHFGVRHGEAVAVGMVVAARISNRMGLLSYSEVDRLITLVEKAGLPARMPDLDTSAILKAMRHDKKVESGQVRFVLLKEIGDVIVSDEVSPVLVAEVLAV
jgi:3-dehydroquinate synthase